MSETTHEQATDNEAEAPGAEPIEMVEPEGGRGEPDPDPADARATTGPKEAVADDAPKEVGVVTAGATVDESGAETLQEGAAVPETVGTDAASTAEGDVVTALAATDEDASRTREGSAGGEGAAADEDAPADMGAADEDFTPGMGAAADEDVTADEGAASSRSGHARSRKAPSRAQLEKEGEIAADFLETLLDICDLDGDLDVDIDGDRAAVSIVDSEDGRVPRRLVGANGKVLDALQELTRLAVYASTGDRSRLVLDIAGHRSDRRSELARVARVAIESVKETGQQQALEPMSPFERKIIHDEVLAAGLHSESDGKEPHRFVVVHPA